MLQVPESERPVYDFEFTSGMFDLNSDRQLVVRTDNLDRDSPNQPVLTLQVDNNFFGSVRTSRSHKVRPSILRVVLVLSRALNLHIWVVSGLS